MMIILQYLKKIIEKIRIQKDPVSWARSQGVIIGENCRLLGVNQCTFGSEPYLVKLGNHVSITDVTFVTHDGGVWVFRERYPDVNIFGPIVVGNNVFIGIGSIILPGVNIGDNCIIGAGSIVTKDIPSNSVAAGVPARIICSIDEYWAKNQDKITNVNLKNMSELERRKYLVEKFAGKLQVNSDSNN